MYHIRMTALITRLLACCFGSAMAQSGVTFCEGDRAAWNNDCVGSHTYASGDKYVGGWKDGNGRNSPFTKHLLQAFKQPNVPKELVFKEVRQNVMAETAGEQVPWENSSLVGDFYFTVAR